MSRRAQFMTFRGRAGCKLPTMSGMKQILFSLLLLLFALDASSADSCAVKRPRTAMDDAMDEIHAVLNGDNDRAEEVVAKWQPQIALELEKPGTPSAAALHAAVDLARQLVNLGRREEARTFFARVSKLDPNGEWGRKAAGHIRSMGSR